jgi:hypothetical protein
MEFAHIFAGQGPAKRFAEVVFERTIDRAQQKPDPVSIDCETLENREIKELLEFPEEIEFPKQKISKWIAKTDRYGKIRQQSKITYDYPELENIDVFKESR